MEVGPFEVGLFEVGPMEVNSTPYRVFDALLKRFVLTGKEGNSDVPVFYFVVFHWFFLFKSPS